jgi:hypothetical protein
MRPVGTPRRIVLAVALLGAASCSLILGIDDVKEGSVTPDAPAQCYIDPVLNFIGIDSSQDSAGLTFDGTQVVMTAALNTGSTVDFFDLVLFAGAGAFTGTNVQPGTYTIDAIESSYDTCGVCVLIYADTTSTGSTLQFKAQYLANAGTVTITEVSPKLVANFSNLRFRHVDIDSASGQTTVIDDGCSTSVSSGTIDLDYTSSPDAGVGGVPDAP